MIVTCPNCGAKNRVDERAAKGLRPKCGRCGTVLEVFTGSTGSSSSTVSGGTADTGKPISITDVSLAALLRSAGEKPVLVDCWAEWCPPCRAIAPTIDQLAAEAAGRYVVAKIDVDSNPRTAAQYRIEGIPALLIFKQGQLVDRLVGLQPKHAIAARLQSHV